jgi:MFS family permease
MKKIPLTVFMLGLASLFTDMSSEMIYPLLPVFLTTTLGAGAVALGIIEVVAESTAAFLKVISGVWTDLIRKRKPFILAGYGLAGAVRPLIGLATVWPFVMAMRFMDRIGKGLRTSPRDALIADVTDPSVRGAAFGVNRALDHMGAVIGPLIAAALLHWLNVPIRHIFLLAAIPAVIVILIITLGVKDKAVAVAEPANGKLDFAELWREAGGNLKLLFWSLFVFTLGNSTDAFLLLRMNNAGVSGAGVAVLWSAHHMVKVVCTYFGGRLSDKVDRRKMIVCGWVVYAVVYCLFAVVDSKLGLIAVFLAYGIYFGLTEPVEKALVADLAPQRLRGTAFGIYNGVISIGALPASAIFGLLWKVFGVETAFITGAVLAIVAAFMLMAVQTRPGDGAEAQRAA